MPMIPSNYILIENMELMRLGLKEFMHVGDEIFRKGLYAFIEPAVILADMPLMGLDKYRRRYIVLGPNTIAIEYRHELLEILSNANIKYYITSKPVWVKGCKIPGDPLIRTLHNSYRCIHQNEDYKAQCDQNIEVFCAKYNTIELDRIMEYKRILVIHKEQREGDIVLVKPFHPLLYGVSTFLNKYPRQDIDLVARYYLGNRQSSYDILAYFSNANVFKPYILINEKNRQIIIKGIPKNISERFMGIVVYNSLLYLFCS